MIGLLIYALLMTFTIVMMSFILWNSVKIRSKTRKLRDNQKSMRKERKVFKL